MRDGQVLGVGVVGINNDSSLSKSCEMLLGGGGVVGIKGSNSSIGVGHQLSLGCNQHTCQDLTEQSSEEISERNYKLPETA